MIKLIGLNILKIRNYYEYFIINIKDYLDLKAVCKLPKLTENYVKQFIDYVEWEIISIHKALSESFIENKQESNWI